MSEKDTEQKKKQNPDTEKINNPGEIKGKIEVPDTRERQDGPGGN